MKLGRNDPCHCGSGLKYKKCHAAKDDEARSAELAAQAAARATAAAEAAAAAEEEGEGESEKAAPATGAQKRPPVNQPDRIKRPKLPTAHAANLPRRGAV
jgi:SEC-C motif